MKRLPFYLLIAVLMISIILENRPVLAKSYSLPRIDIHARIQADGSMQLTEKRTYQFDGSFSWADYQLPLQGIGQVRYFSLQDDFRDYRQSSAQSPGTYYIEQDDKKFYVRWFYQAKNETRTFSLQYTVTRGVTCYLDVAEFYYKFVGASNMMDIGEVIVTIQLPEAAHFPDVRAWAHGPLWGTVAFESGQVVLRVKPLPAQRFWEARLTFPTEWMTENITVLQQEKLPTILQEEESWSREANLRRQEAQRQLELRHLNNSKALNYAIIVSVLGAIILLLLYMLYGRGHQVSYSQAVSSEFPKDEPPAYTSVIFFNKQVYGAAMTATLFDLARRGYLKIEQEGLPEKKWWGVKPPDFSIHKTFPENPDNQPLLDFEVNLLHFIFEVLGQGSASVRFKAFKKNSTKVRRWFQKWRKLVLNHLKDLKYYDKQSIRGTIYGVVLSLVISGIGVLILFKLGEPGFIAIVSGSVGIGLSFLILRYTPEVKLRRKKLTALKNYLKKYYFLEERNRQDWLTNIEGYLIYGIALGLGKKVIEKILLSVPSDQQTSYFPWYYYPHGAASSPASFATAVSTMVSIASSTVSSSTGSGGGASGGGG